MKRCQHGFCFCVGIFWCFYRFDTANIRVLWENLLASRDESRGLIQHMEAEFCDFCWHHVIKTGL